VTKVIWYKAKSLPSYSPGGSNNLQQFAIATFGWGFDPQISPSLGVRDKPYVTQCALGPASLPAKWHLNPSNDSSRVHECDRRQTDRPRYGEMSSYRRNHLH